MVWIGAHCAFAVEMFLETGEFVMPTQRTFHAHFMLCQNDAVPERKLILLWIENSIQNSIIP